MNSGRKLFAFLLAGGTLAGMTTVGIGAVAVPAAYAAGCKAKAPGQGCGDPSTASITVTPYTGLVSGEPVTVSGTGFADDQVVGVSMCKGNKAASNDCDSSTYATTVTSATGTFSLNFTVKSPISVKNKAGTSITFTCGTTTKLCSIGASNFAETGSIPAAYEDVGFAPATA